MKIIDIPDTIELELGGNKEPMSFLRFLETSVSAYEPLGTGYKNILQGARIHKILKNVNGHNVVQFENADFDVVDAAIEKIKWLPDAARQLLPYYEAVKSAQDVDTPTHK